MNVCILLRTQAVGGLEKQALELFNLLSEDGHNVKLILVYNNSRFLSPWPHLQFPRSSEILRDSAVKIGPISFLCLSMRLANSLVNQLASSRENNGFVLVSFGFKENLLAIVSRLLLKVRGFGSFKIIISERNHPKYSYNSLLFQLLRLSLYPLSDILHVQTSSVRSWFLRFSTMPPSRIVEIPNLADSISLEDKTAKTFHFESSSKNIHALLIGNKPYQKGFDFLVDSLPSVQDYINATNSSFGCKFSVFGSDISSNDLIFPFSSLLQSYNSLSPGLKASLTFHGRKNISEIFRSSYDCFLLLSRYEGYPNVLIEAVFRNLLPIVYLGDYGVKDLLGEDYPLVIPSLDAYSLYNILSLFSKLSPNDKYYLHSKILGNFLHSTSRTRISRLWSEAIVGMP